MEGVVEQARYSTLVDGLPSAWRDAAMVTNKKIENADGVATICAKTWANGISTSWFRYTLAWEVPDRAKQPRSDNNDGDVMYGSVTARLNFNRVQYLPLRGLECLVMGSHEFGSSAHKAPNEMKIGAIWSCSTNIIHMTMYATCIKVSTCNARQNLRRHGTHSLAMASGATVCTVCVKVCNLVPAAFLVFFLAGFVFALKPFPD